MWSPGKYLCAAGAFYFCLGAASPTFDPEPMDVLVDKHFIPRKWMGRGYSLLELHVIVESPEGLREVRIPDRKAEDWYKELKKGTRLYCLPREGCYVTKILE